VNVQDRRELVAIDPASDPGVRQALYAAAHALMTRSEAWSTLKAWGLRLAKTRGHKREE
jgi:transposase